MSASVLDIEHLRPLFAGASEELKALVDETVSSSAALIEKLDAQSIGPSREIAKEEAMKLAHELKGLTRTVGAEELGTLSERAEQAAASGQWDDFAHQVASMRVAHRRFADAVLALGDDIAEGE